jgi:hypothetical protein
MLVRWVLALVGKNYQFQFGWLVGWLVTTKLELVSHFWNGTGTGM